MSRILLYKRKTILIWTYYTDVLSSIIDKTSDVHAFNEQCLTQECKLLYVFTLTNKQIFIVAK